MKTLTKILGVIAIAGVLTGILGYGLKNSTTFTVGASELAIGGIGYVIAKSKENENSLY
jgi:hypothetical protein